MFETGLIYRNSKPHLYSRQASFPSLALLPGGELLAAFGVGSGFESADHRTMQARSTDGGRSWQQEGQLFSERAERPTSSNVRISRMPDGELVLMPRARKASFTCSELRPPSSAVAMAHSAGPLSSTRTPFISDRRFRT